MFISWSFRKRNLCIKTVLETAVRICMYYNTNLKHYKSFIYTCKCIYLYVYNLLTFLDPSFHHVHCIELMIVKHISCTIHSVHTLHVMYMYIVICIHYRTVNVHVHMCKTQYQVIFNFLNNLLSVWDRVQSYVRRLESTCLGCKSTALKGPCVPTNKICTSHLSSFCF